jgi:hypothetical protein
LLLAATDCQLRVLQWLLLQLQPRRGPFMQPVTVATVCAALQGQMADSLHHLNTCRCIIKLQHCNHPTDEQGLQAGKQRLMAYHGTDFANVHSILHNGLLAASGTRLQTYGAVFGSGVYLSSDFDVAFAFSKGAEAWGSSCIGRQLRCVLLCDVDPAAAMHGPLHPAQLRPG